ncbi:putative alpha/Beta hydrolase [Lupinus albus]|uniref:Putative alpha/Beta hydrolase n=1 Tax=Lupinus albus TaxID=3870 RepID=A0A6A4Q6Z5_LUPAL|nr:putative alpha/Beta hydrolase [Lupinus albus]
MEKLGVKKFDVVGTSYGGFVAYHLAMMLGEEKVEKVVIASSGVNMRKSDNVALLERAEMDKIEDLMLPSTPQHLRKLMALSVSSMRLYIPDFFLKDFLNVSSLFFYSFFFLYML